MSLFAQVVSLLQAGDATTARSLLQSCPEDNAHHHFLTGACAHALGDIPGALQAFTNALRLEPGHAQAASALGSLYAGLGRRLEAEALFRQTLARTEDTQLRFNLAVNLEDSGRPLEALQEYSRILQQQPAHYAARYNRAGLFAREKRLSESAEDYRLLVQNHPDKLLPRHNLGELELALGYYEAAITHLEIVEASDPANSKALLSLAVALAATGSIDASRQAFARLQIRDPGRWEEARARLNNNRGRDTGIDPRLIFLVRQQDHLQACNWQYWPLFANTFSDFIKHPGDGEATAVAYFSMASPISAKEQLQLMQHLASQITHRVQPFVHMPSPAPARLRIGYAASRFGHHVTGLLFRNFFPAHDPSIVEVYLLSLGEDDGSENMSRLRTAPGLHWIDLSKLDDASAAAHVKALELDVIIDLAVYNDGPRPEVLAFRPAPVQITWQGAAYSSGAPWFDYVISDPLVSPAGEWCSEAEVQWPDSYFVFSHDGAPPQVPDRTKLGLPEEKFVFACLNTAVKIEPGIFDSWMRILHAAPDSVLWLLASSTAEILNLKREAEWRGIDPRRLLFANRVAPEEHLARQGAADLFLDTAFFNGHTTIAESLWAGTPALTCPGNTFASRVGASLVAACGLPELIAQDRPAYETLAIALYHDRAHLEILRDRLAINRLQASPFNLRRQAERMEKTCRQARDRFALGLSPAAFTISN